MLKNKSRSKESCVHAIENNQYINGSTDTDAVADCRFIIRFVFFFLNLTYLSKSVYGVFICK